VELNLCCPDEPLGFPDNLERHAKLTTITLDDPNGNFTPEEHQKLRSCGNRNVMLLDLIRASNELNTPAPPQVPRFLTTCNNCTTAALALLVSLKGKVGPPSVMK